MKQQDKIREDSIKAFSLMLNKMTNEEKKYWKNKFKDNTPKGWVSIEKSIPKWLLKDAPNPSKYKVKNADGNEFFAYVTDHESWYLYAKKEGITHWWND